MRALCVPQVGVVSIRGTEVVTICCEQTPLQAVGRVCRSSQRAGELDKGGGGVRHGIMLCCCGVQSVMAPINDIAAKHAG